MNGLALLVIGARVVFGAVWENSFVVVGLTASGTVVRGWSDFQKNSRSNWARVDSTYEKTLIELRTYVRASPLEELDGFSAWAWNWLPKLLRG